MSHASFGSVWWHMFLYMFSFVGMSLSWLHILCCMTSCVCVFLLYFLTSDRVVLLFLCLVSYGQTCVGPNAPVGLDPFLFLGVIRAC